MGQPIIINNARFAIGDMVKHQLLEYRGLVLDIDPAFDKKLATKSEKLNDMPSQDQPWYQVLVHGTSQMTYVPEQHLQCDYSEEAILHPAAEICFHRGDDGQYHRRLNIQ